MITKAGGGCDENKMGLCLVVWHRDNFTAGEAGTFAHIAVTLCVCESIIKALNQRDNVRSSRFL